MKKLFVSIIASLAFLTGTFAQIPDETGLFFGAGAGVNIGKNGQSYVDREVSSLGAGTAADFTVGYWFTSLLGARAGYQGFTISDTYATYGSKSFSYVHADALFRVYHSVVPYVHLGAINIDKWSFGGGAGLMFPVAVSEWLSIVPDVKAMASSPSVYGVGGSSPALTFSATVGLVFHLNGLLNK